VTDNDKCTFIEALKTDYNINTSKHTHFFKNKQAQINQIWAYKKQVRALKEEIGAHKKQVRSYRKQIRFTYLLTHAWLINTDSDW
jgi:hypothetical protein